MDRSKVVEHENEFFIRNVVNETYTDLRGEELAATLRRLNRGVTPGDLTNLLTNETRVLRASGEVRDPVDLVLRVAEINMEVIMSTHADGADLSTSEGAEKLLAGKLIRAGVDRSALRGFARLMDLNSMPDIGALMEARVLSCREVFDLRQQPVARGFRQWMREQDAPDPEELARRYVIALRMEHKANTLPVKAMRMGITAAVEAIAPGLGTAGKVLANAVGTTDSLFADKWMSGYSPRLFFDELAKLQMGQ
jgi:hypothetical protein